MAEYIERRRLFNALADYWNIPHDWDGGIAQPYEDALAFIENAPEEDVAPVAHGQWFVVYENETDIPIGCVCSNCKKFNRVRTHYCPHCGARMDLEE